MNPEFEPRHLRSTSRSTASGSTIILASWPIWKSALLLPREEQSLRRKFPRKSGGRRASILRSQTLTKQAVPLAADQPLEKAMKSENNPASRNPFGVIDVPNPNDDGVMQFARITLPEESATDENAEPWSNGETSDRRDTIEGQWSSRWKGAADPTIPGDTPDQWKQGRGEARIVGDRVYLLFDWDSGARRGLIDAQREGPRRLVGKYINLNNPEITVPWIGLVVSDQRIDGYFSQGRVDFRR